jgi:hypothetical protein
MENLIFKTMKRAGTKNNGTLAVCWFNNETAQLNYAFFSERSGKPLGTGLGLGLKRQKEMIALKNELTAYAEKFFKGTTLAKI